MLSVKCKDRLQRLYRALVVVFVVVLLGAQFSTLIATAVRKPFGAWYWPIIDYPMYASPGASGDSIDSEFILRGVLDDGTEVNITRADLGLNVFHYGNLTAAIRHGEPNGIAALQKTYKQATRLRQVKLLTSGRVIERNGILQREAVVMRSVDLPVPADRGAP